jgi:hypothetical protein
MSELEQSLIAALEGEDIQIEHQSDGSYMAIWPSRYSRLDSATGRPNLMDSATGSSLIDVAFSAIHSQKRNEYWRGRKDALDQAMNALHKIAQDIFKEPIHEEPANETSDK